MNGFRLSGSCTMPMCSATFSSGGGLDSAAALPLNQARPQQSRASTPRATTHRRDNSPAVEPTVCTSSRRGEPQPLGAERTATLYCPPAFFMLRSSLAVPAPDPRSVGADPRRATTCAPLPSRIFHPLTTAHSPGRLPRWVARKWPPLPRPTRCASAAAEALSGQSTFWPSAGVQPRDPPSRTLRSPPRGDRRGGAGAARRPPRRRGRRPRARRSAPSTCRRRSPPRPRPGARSGRCRRC